MYGQDMTYLCYGGRSYGQSPKLESSSKGGLFCSVNILFLSSLFNTLYLYL